MSEKESTDNLRSDIASSESGRDDNNDTIKSDPLLRCIVMLEGASTDTEKFAALLMVTKLLKIKDLDDTAGKKLLDAVGLNFLERMLSTEQVPEGCPQYLFKSIALTVLSSFVLSCKDDRSLQNRFIPCLTDILSHSELYEEDLTIVKEAYQCLNAIASEAAGRKALMDMKVIESLVDAYVDENIFNDKALQLICCLAADPDCKIWDEKPETFTKFMNYLCKEFSSLQNDHKFYLCEILADIIPSVSENSDMLSSALSWTPFLHKGISDILFSKLNQDYRNKGLLLASAALEVLGLSFIVNGGERGQQLLLIIVHLACIEVRMSLEDKSFHESVSSARPTTACYSIIEEAIKFLVSGAVELEGKQKQQLYSALKGAFNGVLEFLHGASLEDISTYSFQNEIFIYASIKVLAAWLAEETAANKEEIYQLLPYLIKTVKYNYNKIDKRRIVSEELPVAESGRTPPDLLRFLLPGLCHLTAEDHPRQILLDLDIEMLLLDYLSYQWNLNRSNRSTDDKNVITAISNSDAMITVCNIFMNIVVQEPSRVKSELLYLRLFKFILTRIQDPSENKCIQLLGCFCTLGLMIFRHQFISISKADMTIFRFIQSAVRFLWDGHNVEESTDYATLVISSAYKPVWSDLAEYWFLSIQTLTLLLPLVPWICDFLIESEWPQNLIETFLLVKEGGIEIGVKTAYEDFLCGLTETSKPAKEILLIKGVATVCKNHKLEKLSSSLTKKQW